MSKAQMWDRSHKCLVFQHTVKQTAITHLHRIEREAVTDCSLLHNNTYHHTAVHMMTTIPTLNRKILNNPSYSSDLMTSDFYLAGLIKKEVRC